MKENNSEVDLQGYIFTRVKLGLDEEQVKSVLAELLDKNDKLNKRQEHMSSLYELAERTVAEADELAKRIESETLKKAKDESQAILNRAGELLDQGQAQLALQVLDLLFKKDPNNNEARKLHLKILEVLCKEDYCLMSRNTWVYFMEKDMEFLGIKE